MSGWDNIIGQERAKSRLKASVESFKRGGITLSPLLEAQKGGGKTALADVYCRELEKCGALVYRFASPAKFRSESGDWELFCDFWTSPEPGVLFIDEVHLLNHKPTIRLDKAKALLMEALDKNNAGRRINIDSDNSFVFDRKVKTVVLATNFPDKLDSSGALQSRADRIILDEYTQDEALLILKKMLENKGFHHLNDGTIEIIARCSRGSARPLEKVTDELEIILSGKSTKTISRDEVKLALKNVKVYPFGLNENELKIMERAIKPLKLPHIHASLPQIETRAFRKSVGYLFTLEFLRMDGIYAKTTKKGQKYLAELKEHGFV
jgi:Holliday junction resolvasome RuvABC ATP-dependent DNA helicase subunit